MEPPELPWFKDLKTAVKTLTPPETADQKAIRLLNEQLTALQRVRFGLNYKDPDFKAWRVQTASYLGRFLSPTSPYLDSFANLTFASRTVSWLPYGSPPRPANYVRRVTRRISLGIAR
jgi:hypothetical protein